MESALSATLLQHAIGTTISGSAQVINAGRDVILHGSPAHTPVGMSGFILFYPDYQMLHGI